MLDKGTNHLKVKIYLTSKSAASTRSKYAMCLTVIVYLTHILPFCPTLWALLCPLHFTPPCSPSCPLPVLFFFFFLVPFPTIQWLQPLSIFWSVCLPRLFRCRGTWPLAVLRAHPCSSYYFSNVKRRLFPSCIVKSPEEKLWADWDSCLYLAQTLVCGMRMMVG